MIVAARKTIFKKVPNEIALAFTKANHRQGLSRPGGKLKAYGLYSLEDELIAVALFCNPRTSGMQKRYTTELFRLSFLPGLRVQGGASKLIKNFILTEEPWDLFTYQDTAGEATDVYSYAGLNLVGPSAPKPKKILVKDGLTRATAADNHKDWISLEQASRLGPDALLGTKIGSVYESDGTRKSNIQLFLELGYHYEELPGDRLFEWRNPKVGFYTYRITSSVDSGYYIGRRTIRKPSPTMEECMEDIYWGSGGEKMKNWVAKVGKDSLNKQVTGIYSKWSESVSAETRLIGTAYKDDSNCKNTKPGGVGLSTMPTTLDKKHCLIHGEGFHRGNSCMKCSSTAAVQIQKCIIHGDTAFMGDACKKCAVTYWNEEFCSIHGKTLHRKGKCEKCNASIRVTMKSCLRHGLVKFQGDSCGKCAIEEAFSIKNCNIHGVTKFRGESCDKCTAAKNHELRDCPRHGLVEFIGDKCRTCIAKDSLTSKLCSVHGETSHNGDSCLKCVSDAKINMRLCIIHGESKHSGEYCFKCGQSKLITEEQCNIHGFTKFQHGVCTSCKTAEKFSTKVCDVHGETKFIGSTCSKCTAAKTSSMRACPKHGITKHSGAACRKCISESQTKILDCPRHGETKHKGNSCSKCSSEKTAHTRFHKLPKTGCSLCSN